MTGRRQFLLGGLAPMFPGLPRRRLDQRRQPMSPGITPGSSAGIERARVVIVSGINAGVFLYSGTPGPGNPPVAWMSEALKDPFGNVLPAQGIVSYFPAGTSWAQLAAGQLNFNNGFGQLWSLQTSSSNRAVFAGPLGVSASLSSGFVGELPITQTDMTLLDNANNTSPVDITNAWPIPATDPQVSTIYKIITPLTGTWETAQLNLGIMLDGVFTNITPVAAGAFTATHGIAGNAVLTLTCATTGALGTMNVHFDGTLVDSSVARTPAGSVALGGQHNSLAFDTTAAHTVAIAAQWGASAAGQIVNGVGSEFIRSGP